MLEPYKYRLNSALKGCELEARVKNATKKGERSPANSPAQPRAPAWIPKNETTVAFDNAVFPIPAPKMITYSFAKAVRKSVLISSFGPNEKRFMFNPRASYPDPRDVTHYK